MFKQFDIYAVVAPREVFCKILLAAVNRILYEKFKFLIILMWLSISKRLKPQLTGRLP